MSFNPVRYPGGKGRKAIVDQMLTLYPEGYLNNRVWVEPFCGGCGMGFALIERGIVSKGIFNDGDKRIVSMWRAMANETQRFINDVNNTIASIGRWEKAKQTANDNTVSEYDRGFNTFLLNRFCRSGYIDGGVIGGNKQERKYKIDCRFNKETLTKHIAKIGNLAKEGIIEFHYGDAIAFSRTIEDQAQREQGDGNPQLFFYFDPPYIVKGDACYRKSVVHEALADYIRNEINSEWLLSYDDCPEVHDLYAGYRFDDMNVTYSNNTATRGRTTEVFIRPIIGE